MGECVLKDDALYSLQLVSQMYVSLVNSQLLPISLLLLSVSSKLTDAEPLLLFHVGENVSRI